ncbi:MAG: glucosaminidase domain-containing protein [Bacillota bacterium]
MSTEDFIKAISQPSQASQNKYGILASVIIAQAALESGWGRFVPVDKHTGKKSFNLFGIKGEGPAGYVLHDTVEIIDGKPVMVEARFRAYHKWAESIEDHSLYLLSDRYLPVRQAADYREAARRLQDLGYATDPEYSSKLIRIIEEHRLYQFDIPPGPFPDVPSVHWAARAVAALKNAGVIRGGSDGLFRGDSPATRYEVAVMLYNLMKLYQKN